MMSHKNQLLCVAIFLTFFSFNSPTTYATKPAPKPNESHTLVTEFCNKRSTIEGREFCTRVLKSNPKSISAKDDASLLKISVDLAIENVLETKEYMTTLSKTIPGLKECISAYDVSIGQLRIAPQELEDDPSLASYDALMAHDELINCEKSLLTSKITDDSISSRHNIAKAYVQLCVDIAMTVG
ncbi:hypothetical protein ACH5RR_026654 [Cinchona calisaya]|uniref:Pectinesterase inhibitor domain-containing protein n=1 Tax=Cinchona calisaya TaxID=153742 RepID=A0ABD2Z6C9_9GENT